MSRFGNMEFGVVFGFDRSLTLAERWTEFARALSAWPNFSRF
jgi:hypothetical protein